MQGSWRPSDCYENGDVQRCSEVENQKFIMEAFFIAESVETKFG